MSTEKKDRYHLTCTKCGKVVPTRPDRYDDLEAAEKIVDYLCRDCKPKAEKRTYQKKTGPTQATTKRPTIKNLAKQFDALDIQKQHDNYVKKLLNVRVVGQTPQEIDYELAVLIQEGEFGFGISEAAKRRRLLEEGIIKEEGVVVA